MKDKKAVIASAGVIVLAGALLVIWQKSPKAVAQPQTQAQTATPSPPPVQFASQKIGSCGSGYSLIPPNPAYTAAPNLWFIEYPNGYMLPITCDLVQGNQVFVPYVQFSNGTLGGCYLSAPQDLLSYYASLCGD